MRPTVDDQLGGIDRLLELIAADPTLGAESSLLLRDARRQLGRLRGSLHARRPFIRWDSAASLRVLEEISAALPNDLQETIQKLAQHAGDLTEPASEADETELNNRLRELLAEALNALPQNGDGEAARLTIVEHLRTRVDANPALNKNPITPEETS